VLAPDAPAHREKQLETLILQGFGAFPMVAKRGVSGYNMSYFSSDSGDPEKYRSDTKFQVSQTTAF
jgi:hypothetical protein